MVNGARILHCHRARHRRRMPNHRAVSSR
jgi:hypothetical protein